MDLDKCGDLGIWTLGVKLINIECSEAKFKFIMTRRVDKSQ